MKATLEVINRMCAAGVIDRYAIGGAVGALFYLEASDTEDVDVFITFGGSSAKELVSLAPIYDYLKEHGYTEHKKEGVVIHGWPVQFLPAVEGLGEEALASGITTDLEGLPVRVMTAEHLVALALKTGRGKDHVRILAFIESGKLDPDKLDAILQRHGLVEKWRDFEYKFIKGNKP